MSNYSIEEVIHIIKEEDVKFIRLQFTDIFGNLKNVSISVDQLDKALNNKCMFDGSSIEGFVRIEESDMYLKPDINTFAIFPWRPQTGKVARFICDVCKTDNNPFEGDTRKVLKNIVGIGNKLGYNILNVGPECEFFLFLTDEKGNPTTITHDNAGYFDLGPVDLGENARRDISLVFEDMGYEVEASHHEVAPGQHEIDFKYSNAIHAADAIMTFKLVVKTIAQRHGLHATFMPKPIQGISGSGMHINVSLFKGMQNAFYDPSDENKLSLDAYWFIGGILKHVKSMIAITNPTVNSYKRLTAGYEAPVHIAWSFKNRSPLIRIPSEFEDLTRIELRWPDGSANPYLALAVIFAAGLDGIQNKIEPVSFTNRNLYEMTDDEIEENKIEKLPTNLKEALEEMKKSIFIRKVLGNHIFDKFIEAKENEWENFMNKITQWELDEYLTRY